MLHQADCHFVGFTRFFLCARRLLMQQSVSLSWTINASPDEPRGVLIFLAGEKYAWVWIHYFPQLNCTTRCEPPVDKSTQKPGGIFFPSHLRGLHVKQRSAGQKWCCNSAGRKHKGIIPPCLPISGAWIRSLLSVRAFADGLADTCCCRRATAKSGKLFIGLSCLYKVAEWTKNGPRGRRRLQLLQGEIYGSP